MKINDVRVIEEGYFSDIIQPDASSDEKKKEVDISNKAKPRFMDDFENDFEIDLQKYIKAGKVKPRIKRMATANQATAEDVYKDSMNSLVESMISEASMSLSSWVLEWFNSYMNGVDWENSRYEVDKIAKKIESDYKKDKGATGIAALAELAWKLIVDHKTVPFGAQNVFGASPTASSTQIDDKKLLSQLMNAIHDPKFKQEMISALKRYKN